MQKIIKWCHELKEVDLKSCDKGLNYDNLEFLVENIPPNIEKLKLGSSLLHDEILEILFNRCNKIKTLSVRLITDRSLTRIRQNLNLTLEELSLESSFEYLSFTSFLQLKSMQRLTILNFNCRKEKIRKFNI